MAKELIYDPISPGQLLRDWLATKTLCCVARKSTFQYYDKHLWLPIRERINSVLKSVDRTPDDLELLSCCYTGELFRVQYYNERAKAHVYPLGCYQSWSTEHGLEALSSIGGRILLIRGHSHPEDYAIRTIDLLVCLQPEIREPLFTGMHELSRYCCEHEVVMPITRESIDEIYIVEAEHLTNWKEYATPLASEKWFRNSW